MCRAPLKSTYWWSGLPAKILLLLLLLLLLIIIIIIIIIIIKLPWGAVYAVVSSR